MSAWIMYRWSSCQTEGSLSCRLARALSIARSAVYSRATAANPAAPRTPPMPTLRPLAAPLNGVGEVDIVGDSVTGQ